MIDTRLFALLAGFALMFASCGGEESSVEQVAAKKPSEFTFTIQELSDEEYPDNPDIGFRSERYNTDYFEAGRIEKMGEDQYRLEFYASEAIGDTISFDDLSLAEFIPTVPKHVKDDEYLSYISLVNQEWNRNQVRFAGGEFRSTNPEISRVDVARNCLNACLWEIILYTTENGGDVPICHGWFDFPDSLYAQLFEVQNALEYVKFREPLEHWIDPESKLVNLEKLRTSPEALDCIWEDNSDAMYPLGGARKKKFKEIITPMSFETMRDLQSDSTTFATFAPPGIYDRADPRTTELGRLVRLDHAVISEVMTATGSPGVELRLSFNDGERLTDLLIGGFDLSEIPALSPADCNSGWKSSMGIGNHTFYETYAAHNAVHAEENPYYALLLDGEGKWLDSHAIGIDGPIMHWDLDVPGRLHLWLLSFERHALVGHYTFDTPLNQPA